MAPTFRSAMTAWIVLALAAGAPPALAAPAPARPQPKPSAKTRPSAPKPAAPKPAAPKPRPSAPQTRPAVPAGQPLPKLSPSPPAEPVPRFRVGVFAGTNGQIAGTFQVMPMASVSLGYRLPLADDRLEVLLEVGTGGAVNLQASGLGLQYQWADWGPWHPYVGLLGGVTYDLLPPWNGGVAILSPAPLVVGKLGMEMMIAPWFGLDLGLSGGYPNFWRSQLGAKVAF